MERSLRERVQEIYVPFSQHKTVNKKLLFSLYNEITGKNMQPTNCVTCIVKIKNEMERYLAVTK